MSVGIGTFLDKFNVRMWWIAGGLFLISMTATASFFMGLERHTPHPFAVELGVHACLKQCGQYPIIEYSYHAATGSICVCGK